MMIEAKLAKYNILAGHVHDMIRTVLLKYVHLTSNKPNNVTTFISYYNGKKYQDNKLKFVFLLSKTFF